jgi:hypothetical protein
MESQTNDKKEIEDYLNNNLDKIEGFEFENEKIIIYTTEKVVTIFND